MLLLLLFLKQLLLKIRMKRAVHPSSNHPLKDISPVTYGAASYSTGEAAKSSSTVYGEGTHVTVDKVTQKNLTHLDLDSMAPMATERVRKIKILLGIGFGMVLMASVLVLVLVTKSHKHIDAKESKESFEGADGAITFDEFVSKEFSAKGFNGSWWSEDELQWTDKEGNMVKWNISSHETTILVSQDMLTMFSESGSQFMGFSPDSKHILFALERENIWRHSYTARYMVFDSITNSSYSVLAPDGTDRLRYCSWVENDNDDNVLIYVFENDLYWKPNAATNSTEADIRITHDGIIDNVFNGIPDWVYEEEVLSTNYAHYVSSDGLTVAFAQFNDTEVPEFRYPIYGNPANLYTAQYPEYRIVRYPKAGKTNPTMGLYVRDMRNGAEEFNKPVTAPLEVTQWGEYIYSAAGWTQPDVFSVTWMNRVQNESVVTECRDSSSSWTCVAVFDHKEENGWVELTPPIYSSDGFKFIQILPQLQPSSQWKYKHIAMKVIESGELRFITNGNFVVTTILSWDEVNRRIYFMGTTDLMPGARHLYRVDSDGSGDAECITCTIKTSRGELCMYNYVDINNANTYYIHICRGQGVPEATLRLLSDQSLQFIFEDNADLLGKLQNKTLPTRIDTKVDLPGGFSAPVKILLPPNLDQNKKYPFIVYVYGGPGSQMVDQRWSLGWGDYLVTSREIVYASIDGRGTGFQSDEHLFAVYRQLGSVEIEDQINTTRKLLTLYSYLDPQRTAIWGWSYGGFATAMSLEQDTGPNPVFSCGISVAPVTSWMLYDSIYTERFMGLPSMEDNAVGYNNSVINRIENLRTKKWMLNHGVADDNVHYQHTMLLTRVLQKADIQYLQHSYADENHSLRGVSRFLYHAMDDFWTDCFGLDDVDHGENAQ